MESITRTSTFDIPSPAESKKAKRERIKERLQLIENSFKHEGIIMQMQIKYLADVICGIEDEIKQQLGKL